MNEHEISANIYFSRGKEGFLKGDYQNCIKDLIYAQEMFSSIGKKDMSAETLYMLATSYYQIDQFTQARQMFSLAITRFKELKNLTRIGDCALKLGEIYRSEGNFKRSKQFLAEAIEIYTQLGDLEKLADTWRELANAFETSLDESSSHPSRIINAYKTAINYYKKLKFLDKKAETEFDLGHVMLNQTKFNEAIKYFSDSLSFFTKSKDNEKVVTALIMIGRAHFKMDNKSKARNYMYKAIEKMRKAEYSPEKISQLKKSVFAMLG
ncbi:MAG: tetratricopeptide repeat protein [Candidatus Thorarchaeota archaeon]